MPSKKIEYIRQQLQIKGFCSTERELTDEDIEVILDVADDWDAMANYGADE